MWRTAQGDSMDKINPEDINIHGRFLKIQRNYLPTLKMQRTSIYIKLEFLHTVVKRNGSIGHHTVAARAWHMGIVTVLSGRVTVIRSCGHRRTSSKSGAFSTGI